MGERVGVPRGPEEALGEVGEAEEADSDERFLLPEGTGLGAVDMGEEDNLCPALPSLGFAGAAAAAAGAEGVAEENKLINLSWKHCLLLTAWYQIPNHA